jgi:hypothetical protein
VKFSFTWSDKHQPHQGILAISFWSLSREKFMRLIRKSPWVLSLVIALGPFVAGCSDDAKPKTVVPAQAPTERSKDSMEFHKKEMEAARKK